MLASEFFHSTADGTCTLEVPARWRFRRAAAEALLTIAIAASPSAVGEQLPLLERMAIDAASAERMAIDAASAVALPAEPPPHCSPATYVSLPTDSIFEHASFGLGSNDTLYDLGAGEGLPGVRAVLLHGAARAVGVELSSSRVESGCSILRHLATGLADADAGAGANAGADADDAASASASAAVVLRRGDIRDVPELGEATRVLFFGTCFPRELSRSVREQLEARLPLHARVFAVQARGWDARAGESMGEPERGDAAATPKAAAPHGSDDDDGGGGGGGGSDGGSGGGSGGVQRRRGLVRIGAGDGADDIESQIWRLV